jgi:uncharacterized protein YecT (DUF1311 family)
MRLTLLACAVSLMGLPVSAQDLKFDGAPTETCLIGAGHGTDRRHCIGLAAAACMAQPMGDTTLGMGFCLDQEWQWWDAMLNRAYAELRAAMLASDRSAAPPVSQAEALRDMQRAWITYRDARCAFEAAQWHGGTGAGPAAAGCFMQTTAEQALLLSAIYSGEG